MSATAQATPTHTRAWRIHKAGLMPEVMQLDEEVKLPELKAGQVVVKIEKAGINPVDWKMAAFLPSFVQPLPRCPATDFSGTIVALGPSPTAKESAASSATKTFKFEVDQPVWGTFQVDAPGPQGSLQDYAVVKLENIAPRPSQIDPTAAAGLSIPALTALSMSRHAKKGDRVLLLGGSTTVGLHLADIIKSSSIGVSHVVATASGSKIPILQRRGKIDAFIDYRSGSVEGQLKEKYSAKDEDKAFDVVLDCVGSSATYDASPSYLKPDGKYVNVGASFIEPGVSFFSLLPTVFWTLKAFMLPKVLGGTPRKYIMVAPAKGAESKKELNDLIEQGCLDPLTDSVFGFKEANKAYEKLMTNRAMGKVVIDVLKD